MAGRPLSMAGPDFQKQLKKAMSDIEKSRRPTMRKVGEVAVDAHLSVLRPHSGGDLRLSGANRAKGRPGNAKIGARYEPRTSGNRAQVVIKKTGPVQLIANDTAGRVIRSAYAKGKYRRGSGGKSQFIGPTFGGQFKGDRRAVLNIPGIGYRRSARHPGTKGKDSWVLGELKAAPIIERTIREETLSAIQRGFR